MTPEQATELLKLVADLHEIAKYGLFALGLIGGAFLADV